MRKFENIWYQGGLAVLPLLPLSWLFRCVVAVRRWFYKKEILKINRFSVPLVVVGNITVGGTGKTPFVIWLSQFLRDAGYRPGIVLRGYGGNATEWPQRVDSDSDPLLVGDEAVLLYQRCRCPTAVGPDRSAAVNALLQDGKCDIIISDDGLQHYAMGRDIEVVIVDGQRRFGNGKLLPAGPLREPVTRLSDVDLVIVNGGETREGESSLTVSGCYLYNLHNRSRRVELSQFAGEAVHAVAGIGNPQRFFEFLSSAGVAVIAHPFADHHAYQASELMFGDEKAVLMTEKDAVKCAHFVNENVWVVAIEMAPSAQVEEQLCSLLELSSATDDDK